MPSEKSYLEPLIGKPVDGSTIIEHEPQGDSTKRRQEWQSTLSLRPAQILDAFSDECKVHIPRAIARQHKYLHCFRTWLKDVYRLKCDDFSKWFICRFAPFAPHYDLTYLEELKVMNKYLKRPKNSNKYQPLDIKRAKAVSWDLIVKGRYQGRRFWGHCPLHIDRTESLAVNKDNTAHCYSCGFHGSNADMIMKRDNLTFVEAVKYILSI